MGLPNIPGLEVEGELGRGAHSIVYRGFLDGLKIPFIIDHMGRPEAKLGVKQDAFLQMLDLMKNPLAWTKVSGPERISSTGKPFHDAEPFVRELIAAAPDLAQVDWASDVNSTAPQASGDRPSTPM